MPLPSPKKGEDRDDFVSRFMRSKQAKKDFDSRDQRLAVAHSKWRRRKRK